MVKRFVYFYIFIVTLFLILILCMFNNKKLNHTDIEKEWIQNHQKKKDIKIFLEDTNEKLDNNDINYIDINDMDLVETYKEPIGSNEDNSNVFI